MILFIVLVAALFATESFAQTDQAPDPWARWQFLLGKWTASGLGAPGEAVGGFSFAYDLGGKILVRRNRADYPPKPGEKTGFSDVQYYDLFIEPDFVT